MRMPQRTTVRWMLCLALALTLAACATVKAPSKLTPTVTAPATSTSTAPATSGVNAPISSFVCANPPGSTETYAYLGPDKGLYIVHGCAQSAPLPALDGRHLSPRAFSPDGAWLLADDVITDNNATAADFDCLALVNVATHAVTHTALCNPDYMSGGWAQWYTVIAWGSANTFFLASTGSDLSVKVMRVAVPSLTQTLVTRLPWVAAVENSAATPSGIELRQNALYYGGYQSSSEGGAWLHRYDLTTGADTRFVRLGLAGSGGCQVADVPCSWTGPWDISPDATRLAYHNPGPTHDITDTYVEQGQPLYLSALDGSNAQRLFPATPITQGFSAPIFSPDGAYIVMPTNPQYLVERLRDGHITTEPSQLMCATWTPQPGVMYCLNLTDLGPVQQNDLWNVTTGAHTQLQTGSSNYVWA